MHCTSTFRWTQWLRAWRFFERKLETTVACQLPDAHEGKHKASVSGVRQYEEWANAAPAVMEMTW